jgi:hypothetical protein
MNLEESQQNELAYLILLAMEGKISQSGFERLAGVLRSSAAARRFYADILDVQMGLEDVEVQAQWHDSGMPAAFDSVLLSMLAEYEKIAPAAQPHQPKQPEIPKIDHVERGTVIPAVNKASLITAIGSLAALIFLICFGYLLPPRTTPTVARITRTCDAHWENQSSKLEPTNALYPGSLHLLSGVAEIMMDSGVSVILEAPVQLEIETSSCLFLNRGKLVATVQTSTGDRFVVRTPFSTIVDYGTEFGVTVDSQTAQTFVFQGKVELRSGTDPLKYIRSVKLNTDQGGIADASGQVRQATVPPHLFIRRPQFETLQRAAQGQRYYRWKAFNDQLHRDSALVAHYTFDKKDDTDYLLVNEAPLTGSALNGTLGLGGDRPTWTEGRWPQKPALLFNRKQAHRIVVPARPELAIAGPVTIAAWLYLENENQHGHIVSCREGSKINYQMSWFGPNHIDRLHRNRIQLLRYYEERTERGYSEVTSLEPQRWHFLAVTHDNRTARFYLNGNLISVINDECNAEPTVAELVIGDVPLPGHDQWRFDGIIDEIVILSRVMDDSELNAMYAAGKP